MNDAHLPFRTIPQKLPCLLILAMFWHLFSDPQTSEADDSVNAKKLIVGVDANYCIDMQNERADWKWNGIQNELFTGMAKQGITDFRVRLWTRDTGAHGKEYATEVVKRALHAGLNPYLVIFLSDDWADLMKQPVPVAWKELDFDERAVAIQSYSREIVSHFRRQGLQNHLYEIGNEIDYGICGEYPGKSSKKDAESLSKRLWPRAAKLILASQAGVKESDPDAKFMLHISHWWDVDFCVAFFRFMIDQGVQLDYAGLSYFPSSNIGGSLQMDQFATTVTALSESIHRPIIIPETAYPCTRDFKGQFSRWKYEVLGYPLSSEGQQQWLTDFLAMCNDHPHIHSVYYWSPEWYGEGMWKGFALFDPQGDSRPAWLAFRDGLSKQSSPKDFLYLELVENRLTKVPLAQAQQSVQPVLKKLLDDMGGVNVQYIQKLDDIELLVDGYQVELRGSLMNNLHLKLIDRDASSALAVHPNLSKEDLQRYFHDIDPISQRLAIIVRSDSNESGQSLASKLREIGFEVNIHPKPDDLPLKFGMLK